MIKVYAETNTHAELWATFLTDEMYNLCLPELQKLAYGYGMFITESVEENTEDETKSEEL